MSGYIEDYRALCKSRMQNAEYPLHLLESMRLEIEKGLDGGIVAPYYLREKVNAFARFVDFLEVAMWQCHASKMSIEERR